LRVELHTGTTEQLSFDLFERERRPVRPIREHRIDRVADHYDARVERDRITTQLVGVPLTIVPLVVMPNSFDHGITQRGHALQELRALYRMCLDHTTFILRKLRRLPDDRGIEYIYLADIVQQTGSLHLLHLPAREAQVDRDQSGKVGNPEGMTGCVRIPSLDHLDQDLQ